MSVTVEKQAILASLNPMFEEAQTKGLWFFHHSSEAGEIWCSPGFLRLKQAKDELVWAPEHWELRSPIDYIKALRKQAEELVNEYNDLAKRFGHDNALELSEVATKT